MPVHWLYPALFEAELYNTLKSQPIVDLNRIAWTQLLCRVYKTGRSELLQVHHQLWSLWRRTMTCYLIHTSFQCNEIQYSKIPFWAFHYQLTWIYHTYDTRSHFLQATQHEELCSSCLTLHRIMFQSSNGLKFWIMYEAVSTSSYADLIWQFYYWS